MCSLHSKRNLRKSGQIILATLMAFSDFSMVLAVVFCNFFSVLHYKVTAFVSTLIRDVKSSMPMWPRGQFLWPRPREALASFSCVLASWP